MKAVSILILALLLSAHSIAQEKDLVKIADSIENEGKVLFKSEWASWYGTDIFSAKCESRRAIAGGYISYDNGKGLTNIFFSKGDDPVVLSTISFGYDFNADNYQLDTTNRKFTRTEKELFAIRQTAIKEIYKDTSFFRNYSNAELNPVPVIHNNIKRVYVLTGTTAHGVILFGNDYLIGFDENNAIISKKRLHKNLIPVFFSTDKSKIQISGMHTHLPETGEFITATDICTLMLYEKFTTWNQHIVLSKNYASIWNCKTNELTIKTMEEYQKSNPLKSALENNSH